MSEVDRELLQLAGLSVPEAGSLLGISRQALSKGLQRPSLYFKTPELTVLVQRSKLRGARNIGELSAYIADKYTAAGVDLSIILPYEASLRAALVAASQAEDILFMIACSVDDLSHMNILVRVINEIVDKHRSKVNFIYSDPRFAAQMLRWSVAPMRQHLIDSWPGASKLIAARRLGYRGFVFTQRAAEELDPFDAQRICEHFVSKLDIRSRFHSQHEV